jgi:hypothetical protein
VSVVLYLIKILFIHINFSFDFLGLKVYYKTRGYYRKESAALDLQANTETSNISEN